MLYHLALEQRESRGHLNEPDCRYNALHTHQSFFNPFHNLEEKYWVIFTADVSPQHFENFIRRKQLG